MGAITFSGTFSGTLVGVSAPAQAQVREYQAGLGTVSGMSIGVEPVWHRKPDPAT